MESLKMMMGDKLVIKVSRVLAGEGETRTVSSGGLSRGVVPEPGFVIRTNEPGAIPIYIRDSDLLAAEERRRKGGRAIPIVAESWEDINGNR